MQYGKSKNLRYYEKLYYSMKYIKIDRKFVKKDK